MPGVRLRRMKHPLIDVVLLIVVAFALSGCISSQTPLLSDAAPLFGEQFQLNLYENFVDGKAKTLKTSIFRWAGDRYILLSGTLETGMGLKYFVAQPADGNDLIVQLSNGKTYFYLLGRELADGTYRIISIDQNDVDESTRNNVCVTRNVAGCTIATRAQLDAFVDAAAAKEVNYTELVVISVAQRDEAPVDSAAQLR
jgi:hypothetical protein